MSYYLNFRSQSVGGGVIDPYVLEGDATQADVNLKSVDWNMVGPLVDGKDVLFAVHGFNASYEYGARSLGQLALQLGLGASDICFGVLWPGDYWIPVINYPFEGGVSIDCGRRLAIVCNRWLAKSQSISFVSHSLGARLVLEAATNMDKPTRVLCMTAAAINKDCLYSEYSNANAKALSVSILASHNDLVLRVGFRVGDPISELFGGEDHSPFQPALGYGGPPTPANLPIAAPWQIPDQENYGHNDYLPPGDKTQIEAQQADGKWLLPAKFMASAYHGQPQVWPKG